MKTKNSLAKAANLETMAGYLSTACAARLRPLLMLLLLTMSAAMPAQDYTYTTNNGAITITAYTGSGGAVTIPNKINGLLVTSIGYAAFDGCTSLNSVATGANVTSIGDAAFFFCTSLTNVTIGNSVANIGNYAFEDCTSLTSLTIGNSVANIGNYAFEDCASLTSVTIPKSVTSIGSSVFYDCTGLTGIYFQGNAPGLGDSSVFFGDNHATVYYLPWTTGWGAAMFGNLSTAAGSQQLQAGGAGVRTNQFGFTFTSTNRQVVVEACTNLANPVWVPVGTNTLTGGTSYFSDAAWTNYHGRFYRLRSP